jgi:hypothetical protein
MYMPSAVAARAETLPLVPWLRPPRSMAKHVSMMLCRSAASGHSPATCVANLATAAFWARLLAAFFSLFSFFCFLSSLLSFRGLLMSSRGPSVAVDAENSRGDEAAEVGADAKAAAGAAAGSAICVGLRLGIVWAMSAASAK